jgi:hypothetical protein
VPDSKKTLLTAKTEMPNPKLEVTPITGPHPEEPSGSRHVPPKRVDATKFADTSTPSTEQETNTMMQEEKSSN